MNNVYEALSSIGIRVGSSILNQKTIEFVDIERTIVEGLYKSYEDSKIPSLIITWAKIHHEYIIVEKFGKLIKEFESIMGPCIWINIFNLFCYYEFKNSKFKKLIRKT